MSGALLSRSSGYAPPMRVPAPALGETMSQDPIKDKPYYVNFEGNEKTVETDTKPTFTLPDNPLTREDIKKLKAAIDAWKATTIMPIGTTFTMPSYVDFTTPTAQTHTIPIKTRPPRGYQINVGTLEKYGIRLVDHEDGCFSEGDPFRFQVRFTAQCKKLPKFSQEFFLTIECDRSPYTGGISFQIIANHTVNGALPVPHPHTGGGEHICIGMKTSAAIAKAFDDGNVAMGIIYLCESVLFNIKDDYVKRKMGRCAHCGDVPTVIDSRSKLYCCDDCSDGGIPIEDIEDHLAQRR
jgi:hypothetical protein